MISMIDIITAVRASDIGLSIKRSWVQFPAGA